MLLLPDIHRERIVKRGKKGKTRGSSEFVPVCPSPSYDYTVRVPAKVPTIVD